MLMIFNVKILDKHCEMLYLCKVNLKTEILWHDLLKKLRYFMVKTHGGLEKECGKNVMKILKREKDA